MSRASEIEKAARALLDAYRRWTPGVTTIKHVQAAEAALAAALALPEPESEVGWVIRRLDGTEYLAGGHVYLTRPEADRSLDAPGLFGIERVRLTVEPEEGTANQRRQMPARPQSWPMWAIVERDRLVYITEEREHAEQVAVAGGAVVPVLVTRQMPGEGR